ncbi:MAG: kelch repeat-containing protein [Massilibacteroides sp.]|nr:kelch repeat-containing protein [Massilibacteroides sp.]MDD3063238.1 kelch repeat-containing protein [Massilibacteroides sp.]MDD4115619.1 kelch repeat-containing protein [Massilibacteroides sp.]MDD4661164.1 kelch repeat-containing protein [Massilibacteroides sp.]
MKRTFTTILLYSMCISSLFSENQACRTFVWDIKLILPPLTEETKNPGLAGVFSGMVQKHLLLIGGANFPDKKPWEGGQKQWWATLYDYDLANKRWEVIPDFLPIPLAYGISIQLQDTLLCIGGCDREVCYSEVWSLSHSQGKWAMDTDWPSLPVPLACGTGVLCRDKVYVFGGQSNMQHPIATSLAFVLNLKAKEKGWLKIPSWPGAPKGYAVSVALNGKVYLFGGRDYDDNGKSNVYTDGFVFDPATTTWEKLPGVFPVMAGTAFSDDTETIYFIGGVEKTLPTTPDHPGFSREIRGYNINDKKIENLGTVPYAVPVTTHLVQQDDTIFITSGEVNPGIRTPYILRGVIQ